MIDLNEIANTIESMPMVLNALLAPIDDAALTVKPNEDDWCVLEIIGHLILVEGPAFRERVRLMVDGAAEIPPFAHNEANAARDFADESLADLLDELATERRISAEFIRTLTSDDLEKRSAYKHYGQLAAGDFVYEWPYHDQSHLQQILTVLKQTYLPHMTDEFRYALEN